MPTGIWLYAYFGLWGLALFEALLLMAITRQVGDFHAFWVTDDADQGLPAGAMAPLLPERDLYGRTLPPIASGRTRVLLFISKGCSACHDAMKFVPEAAASKAFDLVLIVGNKDDATRVFMGEFEREGAFPNVLVFADEDRATFEQYQVTVTPYAMVVDDGGAVRAKGVASKAGAPRSDRSPGRGSGPQGRACLEGTPRPARPAGGRSDDPWLNGSGCSRSASARSGSSP